MRPRALVLALLLAGLAAPTAEARDCPGPVLTATVGPVLMKADRVEALRGLSSCRRARSVVRAVLRSAADFENSDCDRLPELVSCPVVVAGETWICAYQPPRSRRLGRCNGESGRVEWRVRDRVIA